MKLSKCDRQKHLDLKSECIEIGGDSPRYRGLLAHYLKTTIPSGMKIHLCHACHNSKCSNPQHLYWGTPSENYADGIINGKQGSPFHRLEQKYGTKEAYIKCKEYGIKGKNIQEMNRADLRKESGL